jgi:hypothetical protein
VENMRVYENMAEVFRRFMIAYEARDRTVVGGHTIRQCGESLLYLQVLYGDSKAFTDIYYEALGDFLSLVDRRPDRFLSLIEFLLFYNRSKRLAAIIKDIAEKQVDDEIVFKLVLAINRTDDPLWSLKGFGPFDSRRSIWEVRYERKEG